MTTTGIIAVTDNEQGAGAITYWTLAGDTNRDALVTEWAAAGLNTDLLPPGPSAESALHRALKELGGKRRLIRPLENGSGWSIVDERAVGDHLEYQQDLIVKIDAAGRVTCTPDDHVLAEPLRERYAQKFGALTTSDISGWLARMARACFAVTLRDTGGVYFVPSTHLDRWRNIVGALRAAAAHVAYFVPAMKSSDAVEAILAAIGREAEDEIAAITEQLDKESIGPRAMLSRITTCEGTKEKLASYEALLDVNLDAIKGRLETLKARLTEAMLMAELDAEAA